VRTRDGLIRAAIAAILLLGCLCGPAAASTAEWNDPSFFVAPNDDSCRPGLCDPPPPVVTVRGEPGERNNLQITREGATLIIRDGGAALRAGNRCTAQADGSVWCPSTTLVVLAGDGDDRVMDGAIGTVDGGAGNDIIASDGTVTGGDGNDMLTGGVALDGGAGDDVLSAGDGPQTLTPGPGADRVTAGAGDDLIVDETAAPAADLIDGGEGVDALLFSGRKAAVTVDLSQTSQRAGSAGENNTITGFELASGGSGDDTLKLALPVPVGHLFSQLPLGRGDDRLSLSAEVRLRFLAGPGNDTLYGSAGRDVFDAGSGRDRVNGRGGADALNGGPDRDSVRGGDGPDRIRGGAGNDALRGDEGRDVLLGESGNDRINSADRLRDRVDCGPGSADSLRADRRDRARRCERVRR
jgi:Ca2+-binding RTX toxin-like protein